MSAAGLRRAATPLGFGLAVVVLVVAGRGPLGTPPVHDLGGWLEARGAVVATVAVARLAALGAAAWMFVLTAVIAVARAVGAVALAEVVETAVPSSVRRALAVAAGIGAVGVPAAGLVAPAGPPGAEAVQLVDRPAGPSTVSMALLGPAPAEPAADPAAEPVAAAPDEPVATPVAVPLAPDPDPDPGPAVDLAAPDDRWTVTAGDSFWSIAEEVVGESLGRPPTDAEVGPYWRAIVEANRDRLVSGDPDLLVPGQVLSVPDPATAATPRS